MSTVPRSTDSISDLPDFLVGPDGYDVADDFMTRDPRAGRLQYYCQAVGSWMGTM